VPRSAPDRSPPSSLIRVACTHLKKYQNLRLF
jgi:hypothetical protein